MPLTRAVEAAVEERKKTDIFDSVEKVITSKESREIRLEKIWKNRKGQSPQDFLVNFFTKWNANRNTIYAESKTLQTDTGRRRSLGDIYLIMKYYYPSIALSEVVDMLYNKLPKVMPSGFRTSYCTTINKRVWYFDETSSTRMYNEDHKDEFGHRVEYYLTKLRGE